MIDEFLNLLESFKHNQISKLINDMKTEVFRIIYSERTSAQIKSYFRNINSAGVPFASFATDPDNISQIKKLINALHYAHLTFIDLEKVDTNSLSRSTIHLFWSHTVNKAYQAAYLLTHLDIDLKNIFSDELTILLPLFSQIQHFAENHAEKTKVFTHKLMTMPLSYEAGKITGVAVTQMQPLGGDMDYNFITQFSATVLPECLNKLTRIIERYSSQIKENEPKLNQEKLDELRRTALHLLNDIESLKGNSVFVSLKFLNYIHIIRHIITLSMSTLEQIGELSESSQDVVITQLRRLKTILARLFGLVDKIEVNAMLEPSTLSLGLMKIVKQLYSQILYLPAKAIDFQNKAEDLLSIETPSFIALRLEFSNQRVDAANKVRLKAKLAREALNHFFSILSKPPYHNMSLSQLSPEIKTRLISHYQLIRPYVQELSTDNDTLIVNALTHSAAANWSSYFLRAMRWAPQAVPEAHATLLLNMQEQIENRVAKAVKSQEFHINLNKNLIKSVKERAERVLLPYVKNAHIYELDEAIPLHVLLDTHSKMIITAKELLRIKNAHAEFMKLIVDKIVPRCNSGALHFNSIDSKTQQTFLELLTIFQHYLIHFTPDKIKNTAVHLVQYLTQEFKGSSSPGKDAPTIANFFLINEYLKKKCTHISGKWNANSDCLYYDLINKCFLSEDEATAQSEEENKKLHFSKTGDKYLLDDSQKLNFDQAFALYQWYINKCSQFSTAQKAYSQCITLLKKQRKLREDIPIKQQPDQLDEQLLCITLNMVNEKPIIEQLENLYSHLQPYIIEALPPEQKAAALNFDRRIVYAFSQKSLGDLNSLLADLLLNPHHTVVEKQLTDITEYCASRSHFYYCLASNTFLAEQQENPLIPQTQGDRAHYLVPQIACALLTASADPQTMPANRLRELVSGPTYILFETKIYYSTPDLLISELYATPASQLKSLFPKEVDKVQTASMQTLTKITALTGHRHCSKYSECVHDFRMALSEVASGHCGLITVLADPEKIQQNQLKKLLNNKQAYVLFESKCYYISQYLTITNIIAADFKRLRALFPKNPNQLKQASLAELSRISSLTNHRISSIFNKTISAELIPKESGVPFPEMEDQFLIFSQGESVRAFKEIYNSLFHLEGIVLQLEKLNDKMYQAPYVYTLLQAYSHINEIIKLCERLNTDVHFAILIRDLIQKAQHMYAIFQQHSEAYQVAYTDIGGKDEIYYNPLWYTLNAFYISPEHIQSLKNINYLTAVKRNELHLEAKKATLIIEKLINSSDSHFKLFLQSKNMVFLYKELTKKFNEFTSTIHDAVADNLDKIRSTVLTPMLLEADLWETTLGLAPGNLSGPLKKITDEYFKGLIYALDLPSPAHISLIGDKEPLKQRIKTIKKQIAQTQHDVKKLKQEYAILEELHTCLQTCKVSPGHQEALKTTYQKALHKLVRLKLEHQLNVKTSHFDADHQFDTLCNTGLKQHEYKFTEVEGWIKAAYYCYRGLQKNHQIKLKTLKEKLSYLEELGTADDNEMALYIKAHTTEAYHKHLEYLCYRPVGLHYMDKEYSAELQKYLLLFKKDIIDQSTQTVDVNLTVQNLLEEKIRVFNQKNYLKYYHMDRIRDALARFRIYLNSSQIQASANRHLFENQKTINEKIQRINTLDEIAVNNQLIFKLLKLQVDEIFDTPDLADEERLQRVKTKISSINANNQLIVNICLQRLRNKVSDIVKTEAMPLGERLQKIRALIEEISINNQLSIEERYQQIKALVQERSFSRIILSHKQADPFSLSSLKLGFISLNEAMQLYTLELNKLLTMLHAVINQKPQLAALTEHFGLFSTPQAPNNAPAQEEVLNTMPR